jgi:hypothetical protein
MHIDLQEVSPKNKLQPTLMAAWTFNTGCIVQAVGLGRSMSRAHSNSVSFWISSLRYCFGIAHVVFVLG